MVTSFFPINTLILDFSSSIAAHDSSCMLSMNPALRPSSPDKDLFYLAKNSMSFCFLKLSFSSSVYLPLKSWSSFSSYSSGFLSLFSSISFILFLSYYCSRLALKSLNYWSFAIKESLSILIWDCCWTTSSYFIFLICSMASWIDWISRSLS